MSTADNWDLLITHANLATMRGGGYGIVENAALAVKSGKIAWLGSMNELTKLQSEQGEARSSGGPMGSGGRQAPQPKILNAEGKWLTPGLIDCHTHLVYAGNRSQEMAMKWAGRPYAEIAQAGGGIVSTMKSVRAASEEELFAQSAKRLEALIREGVTTVEIKSGYGLDLASERKMLRVARQLAQEYPVTIHTTFLGAHALPPEFADKDAYIAHLCEVMLPTLVADGLVDAVDGFCESIAFSPAQIERVFQTAQKLSLPVKLHAEQLSDQNGAALAAKYGALSADHLEYANEEGIRAMAAAGTVAVLLPGAFYFLRETRKPPVELLRKHGVKMALATDCNPGTSPVTSLLLMMNMACVIFGLTPEEALRGVTVNAATALGLTDRGRLEVGKRADLAIWEAKHPLELVCQLGGNLDVSTFTY